MTIGLQDPEDERRRRRLWRLVKLALGLGLLGAVGAFSYQLGREQVAVSQQRLEGAVRQARQRAESLEQELAEARPSETERELLEAIRAKREQGLTAERLRFIIGNASPPDSCDSGGTRRFLVSTPFRQYERNNEVAFNDGTVTITATGQTARDGEGNPESWFNAEAPVTAEFMPRGGEVREVTGTLPLRENMVVDGREYRFTLESGQRGFIRVRAEFCPYP